MTAMRSGPTDRRALFRGFLLACQAATILVTWPLWEPRTSPPILSPIALDLPCGGALLATLVLVLFRPRIGAITHVVVLAAAIALDETRLQPAMLSMALLLVASTADERTWLGRAHLGAQWLWAGVAKLVSPAFFGVMAPAIARALPPSLPHRELAGPLAAVLEVGLGVAACHGPSRRLVAIVGSAFHLVVALGLAGTGLNAGACAWNLALAAAALAFFGPCESFPALVSERRIAAALVLSPALFYLGLLHPSLAHQLYAGTTPTTLTCDAAGACRSDDELRESLDTFGVPIPGRVGLLRETFLARCRPGDRWLARSRTPGAGYDEIVSEARCHDLESSDDDVTGTFSGLNGVTLSSYPDSTPPRSGVGWERP